VFTRRELKAASAGNQGAIGINSDFFDRGCEIGHAFLPGNDVLEKKSLQKGLTIANPKKFIYNSAQRLPLLLRFG
jgi:hypothetical protein